MYLYRFRLNDSPVCPEYGSASENPEHNIFCCPRFCSEKRGLKNLANHYYYYYINLGWAENSQKKNCIAFQGHFNQISLHLEHQALAYSYLSTLTRTSLTSARFIHMYQTRTFFLKITNNNSTYLINMKNILFRWKML